MKNIRSKKNFRLFIFFGVVFGFTLFGNVTPTHAWLDGYSNRKIITIQADNIDSNLSDFPVLVSFGGDTDIGGNMQDTSNFFDIRFTDSSDNVLPYEQETMAISGGSATGTYWVQADLDSDDGGTIYMYYGKSGDTNGSASSTVWNSNYRGVWHLDEGDSTAADFYQDSTTNNNEGQLTDSDGDLTQVDGQIGKAIEFTGDADVINVGNDSSLNLGEAFTLSSWVFMDDYDETYSFMIAKDEFPSGSYDLGFKLGKPYVAINDGSWGEYVSDSVLSTSTWHHITGVRNDSDQVIIYVDGVAVNTFNSVKSPTTVSTNVTLGLRSVSDLEFDGKLDEVRIATSTFTADWIKFAYANMGGQSDFELTFAAEQENIDPTVSTLSPTDDATNVAIDTNLVITFDEIVDAESGNIILKKASDNLIIQTFDVTTDITGSGTTEITINPTSNLLNQTQYYVQIDATAFDDTSGNSYAGISDLTAWTFTTVACDSGYRFDGSVCIKQGAGSSVAPSIGSGGTEKYIPMYKEKYIHAVDTEGVNTLMYIESRADFDIQSSKENNVMRSSVYVQDLDLITNTLTIKVEPTSDTYTMHVGEVEYVDLDNDGIHDMSITFSELLINRIELTFTALELTQTSIKEVEKENVIVDVIPETKIKKVPTEVLSGPYLFTRDLHIGMKGEDVKELQKYLNNQGFSLAESGPGSVGSETLYFGLLTQSALAKFQEAHQIYPSVGYFGILTRGFVGK